jgi:branched-chain amino acid aminotransferase
MTMVVAGPTPRRFASSTVTMIQGTARHQRLISTAVSSTRLRPPSVAPLAATTSARRRWISSSQLTIERTTDPARFDARPAKENLVFGTTMSDHMLMIDWNAKASWMPPRIVPYQDLKISPAASCLHYGLQAFEGLKAYKSLAGNDDGHVLMFRPDMNMKRLQASMERLHLPGSDFDHAELLKCMYELVRLDQKWIPDGEGYSLYLRPTVIGTTRYLGVAPPDSILLFVITSPVGPYYKTGFKPVRLTTDTPYVRAWPGGTGSAKVGGNYAPTMKPQQEASQFGYNQVLWLFGDDEQVTEVGAMNVFFVIRNSTTNRPEIVTPPLSRGDILPGVTRDSILYLARNDPTFGEYDVSERAVTMPEILAASNEGRLVEAFGAGTAAVVSPIEAIQYRGSDIQVPATGSLTQKLWNVLTGIQYGKIQGPEGWSVRIT